MTTLYTPDKRVDDTLTAVPLGGTIALIVFLSVPLFHYTADRIRPKAIPPLVDYQEEILTAIELDKPKPVVEDKVEKPELEPPTPEQIIGMLNNPISIHGDYMGQIGDWREVVGDLTDAITPYTIGQLDRHPRIKVAIEPQLPPRLRKLKGEVVVEFVIQANGSVRNVNVYSSTSRDLEEPALDAIRRSRWQPGEKDGKPVDCIVRQPVRFGK